MSSHLDATAVSANPQKSSVVEEFRANTPEGGKSQRGLDWLSWVPPCSYLLLLPGLGPRRNETRTEAS